MKPNKEFIMYRLKKALYELRQAPRTWYAKLDLCLMRLELKRSKYELAVYIQNIESHHTIVGMYVDDLLAIQIPREKIDIFK